MADVVLGIETSCDETSAAVLAGEGDRPELQSLVILSQDVHRVFGGVVPELASRAHLRALDPVVGRALEEAGLPLSAVDAVAVTQGPGLVGALLVGVCYAKALAAGLGKPLVGVHHLEGHLFAPALEDPDLEPPFVALVVSGGHTLLLDVRAWGRYRILGETRDDAAGEAFDKVAALLELGYPGGPPIERLAAHGRDRFKFPRPMLRDGFDFSFSGLKTAVLHAVRAVTATDMGTATDRRAKAATDAVGRDTDAVRAADGGARTAADAVDQDADGGADDRSGWRADVARSFQDAVIEVLVEKTARAVELTGHPIVVLGGGVACNKTLVARAAERLRGLARVAVARPRFNLDNAAMIARAGWFRWRRGAAADDYLDADPALPWPGLERGSAADDRWDAAATDDHLDAAAAATDDRWDAAATDDHLDAAATDDRGDADDADDARGTAEPPAP